ncbi:hypothetical protein NT6N_26160 [Oceaniferula spumae]|uniref:Uncharacterized protein n=1 Tax=Oceaniferula spumae TaxID=2979115 RepID=A0AAT9FNT5_9BACT
MNVSADFLDSFLGMNISEICQNGFTDNEEQHCAHFIGHILQLDSGCSCKTLNNGQHSGGNLRVREIFHLCSVVGELSDAPSNRPVLVFVIDPKQIDLENKFMAKHRKKHIGVFLNGEVYHYSNNKKNKKVIKESIAEFLEYFENLYAGKQGLYYAMIPEPHSPLLRND